jgi:penicillin-binding protein 1B
MAGVIKPTNRRPHGASPFNRPHLPPGLRRAHKRRRIIRFILFLFIALGVSSFVSALYSYKHYAKLVDARLSAGYLMSRAGIYAAPRVLRVGSRMTPERLVEILRRADYVEGEQMSDVWNGSFVVRGGDTIEINARHAVSPDVPTRVFVRLNRGENIAEITTEAGARLQSYTLEPELLTADPEVKTNARAALSFPDIPPVLTAAILSIEDRRFFDHSGVDAWGIARALWTNANEDRIRQGGSTITQQLVKNTYLTPERTLRRKFAEAMISLALERRLSKQDIFALYCNEVYLGQRGGSIVRGMRQAAQVYFGKDLSDITLSEAATLAGMIRSPSLFAPHTRPQEARARRDTVIAAMLGDGAISQQEAEHALAEPVTVAPQDATSDPRAPYFVDYVNRITTSEDDQQVAPQIRTTIDLELQELATAALNRTLERIDRAAAHSVEEGGRVQGALVALDPHTGRVLAMAGGRDYAESQLNRVTDARRQPGSVFKPIVYAAALENGISPLAMFQDRPREFLYDQRATYRPSNYGGAYSMRDVTMREGLIRSLNVVTVDLALQTGLERVTALAENFGLPRPAPYPSVALGTSEVTPLEIAAAYATFANGGRRITPYVIEGENEQTRNDEMNMPAAPQQIIRPSTAYVITDMLTDVIERGTARVARSSFRNSDVARNVQIAGKTGTSRDGWFVGYTPNLVCAVWIGYDDNRQLDLTGAESALPVWTEFMSGAIGVRPELGGASFTRPSGIVDIEIDSATGFLASSICTQRERVAISEGFAAYPCYDHTNAIEEIASLDNTNIYNSSVAPHTPVESSSSPPRVPSSPSRPIVSLPATRQEVNARGRQTLVNEIRVN